MREAETVKRAKMYLEKMSEGTDPLTGDPVREDDIVRNDRISRCLTYVCGILDKIAETGSYEIKKQDFSLSPQQLEKYPYSDVPVTISAITKGLNSLIDPADTFPLKNGVITEWLTDNGFLMNVTVNGNQSKRVTDRGLSAGIISEKKTGQSGNDYEYVSYSLSAQQFILKNIREIIELNRVKTLSYSNRRYR